jgi:hypothetical protein
MTYRKSRSIHFALAIGDRILVAPQSLGRIVTLSDVDLAMVQLDDVLAVNGAMNSSGTLAEHTTYVTIKNFEWNPVQEHWKPILTSHDRLVSNEIHD